MNTDIWRIYKSIATEDQIAIDYISAIAAIDDDNPNNVAKQLLRKVEVNRVSCLAKLRQYENAIDKTSLMLGQARDIVEQAIINCNTELERLTRVEKFLTKRYTITSEHKQNMTLAQALTILRNE